MTSTSQKDQKIGFDPESDLDPASVPSKQISSLIIDNFAFYLNANLIMITLDEILAKYYEYPSS